MAITPVQGAPVPPSAPAIAQPAAQPQACPACPLVDSSATNAVKIVINEPKVIAKTSSQPQPSQAPCNCDTCTKSFIA